ncbi:proteasome subunit beta type-4 isoform X2 [Rhodnius prolixus]|uniref:proteasome subunit beta type-4 isoform X2 n=1 Tax=Rhodnius prolixus TaxID=13249 RepID=UPI003D18CB97
MANDYVLQNYLLRAPATTTTSVLGIKFNDGVAIAGDIGGYYGKLARYKHLERIFKVNDSTVMSTSGDYADFQHIKETVQQRIISETILEDNFSLKASSLYTWLTRLMYGRRSKFDPLWNNVVVAGYDDGEGFLGVVDLRGLAYEDNCVATGLGSHIALPVLRSAIANASGTFDKEMAHLTLSKCMELLFYRDTCSLPKFQIATITKQGVEISPIIEVKGNWDVAAMVQGFE